MSKLIVERTINVPLDKVWPQASDFTKSPDPKLPLTVIKTGDATKMGVGCERKVKIGLLIFHERLTSISPPDYYTYEILSGPPVKFQRNRVEFRREGESTNIRWMTEFKVRYPGSGWILKMTNKSFFNRFIDELEKIR
ncbi:MAG: SRPBCC family protein [Youngiibacter sp.]|nr:SRPBCC family protein [Youngiibacter sp.]